MLKEPESMDECVYFTNRTLEDGKGSIKCWVLRNKCPKCGKGIMAKPRDPKTGNFKIRAEEYVCPKCKYTVNKDEYAESLIASIKYVCPKCSYSGEIEVPFKRKSVSRLNEETGKRESVKALPFECAKCKNKMLVTQKMK
ncbi:MAG: hypothetical protein PHT54_00540 [Candidatus Nanoarchaeia archaeon]|nr:hypothetical protein [Candidatus Nanoarchaeia archaeon]